MGLQTVTIQVPDTLYSRIKERADLAHHTVEAEFLDLVKAATPTFDGLEPELASAVASLQYLDDKILWQAARAHLSAKDVTKMERLHFKRSSGEALSESEKNILAGLLKQYDYYLLIRARAAEILHQRGHDVAVLLERKKA